MLDNTFLAPAWTAIPLAMFFCGVAGLLWFPFHYNSMGELRPRAYQLVPQLFLAFGLFGHFLLHIHPNHPTQDMVLMGVAVPSIFLGFSTAFFIVRYKATAEPNRYPANSPADIIVKRHCNRSA